MQEGAEKSVPVSVMTAALDTRYLSARKEEREDASRLLLGPSEMPSIDRAQLIEDVKQVGGAGVVLVSVIRLGCLWYGWVGNNLCCFSVLLRWVGGRSQALFAAKICSYAQGMNLIKVSWTALRVCCCCCYC